MKVEKNQVLERYLSNLIEEPKQKTKHILHLDLHFREETEGFFFNTIDDEKFTYHMIVQNIQKDLRKKEMLRQVESCLDNILSNSSSEQLLGIIINPNFSKKPKRPDHEGFWFVHDLIRGRTNTSRYKTAFLSTPVLFYTDYFLTYLKKEKVNGFEPFASLFKKGISNLNTGELPQLNSYIHALNQTNAGLQKWIQYIQNH